MHIRISDGSEKCTGCGADWVGHPKYGACCNNCLCPARHCTVIDDVAAIQAGLGIPIGVGPLRSEVLSDLRKLVEEQLALAVPPISWPELVEQQPLAKLLVVDQ